MWPFLRATAPMLAMLLLGAQARPAPIRLLTLGDSFTAGTGAGFNESFPDRLVALWRAAGREVILRNPATNGFTSGDVIQRELVGLEYFKPTRVTLAVGANDIVRRVDLETYRAHVRAILAAVLQAGVAPREIWVLPQPHWAQSPAVETFGDPEKLERRIHAYDAVLREEALATHARWIDLEPLMQQQAAAQALAADGLHPSAEAYAQWAEALAKLR
jgi:lysophospholipase L1-like esterase